MAVENKPFITGQAAQALLDAVRAYLDFDFAARGCLSFEEMQEAMLAAYKLATGKKYQHEGTDAE